jgi:hypothetical protein
MLAQPSRILFTASVCQAEILAGIAVLPQGRLHEILETAARTSRPPTPLRQRKPP